MQKWLLIMVIAVVQTDIGPFSITALFFIFLFVATIYVSCLHLDIFTVLPLPVFSSILAASHASFLRFWSTLKCNMEI